MKPLTLAMLLLVSIVLFTTTALSYTPFVQIRYRLNNDGVVWVEIYRDANGSELIKRICTQETQTAGPHIVQWDGTNTQNTQVSNGYYYCWIVFEYNTTTQTKMQKIEYSH